MTCSNCLTPDDCGVTHLPYCEGNMILQRKWSSSGSAPEWSTIATLTTQAELESAQKMVENGEYEYRIIEGEK